MIDRSQAILQISYNSNTYLVFFLTLPRDTTVNYPDRGSTDYLYFICNSAQQYPLTVDLLKAYSVIIVEATTSGSVRPLHAAANVPDLWQTTKPHLEEDWVFRSVHIL